MKETLKSILSAVFKALLTEAVMKKVAILLLEWLAAKSSNDLDDKIVAEVKKALEK